MDNFLRAIQLLSRLPNRQERRAWMRKNHKIFGVSWGQVNHLVKNKQVPIKNNQL